MRLQPKTLRDVVWPDQMCVAQNDGQAYADVRHSGILGWRVMNVEGDLAWSDLAELLEEMGIGIDAGFTIAIALPPVEDVEADASALQWTPEANREFLRGLQRDRFRRRPQDMANRRAKRRRQREIEQVKKRKKVKRKQGRKDRRKHEPMKKKAPTVPERKSLIDLLWRR